MSLIEERERWEAEALSGQVPMGCVFSEDTIGGVHCLWVCAESCRRDEVVVYLHGGGLVAGSVLTHKHFAATMAKVIGANVLLVNYRLLPENLYPAPLDDVVSVYNAMVSAGTYVPDKLILGGDSSGSGLALAALVQLRDAGTALPRCAFSLSGAFDMTLSGESMRSVESTDPHMSIEALEKWQSEYLPNDLASPLLSPLFADLTNLPPVLLLAGGLDPWVNDSERVAEKIQAGGGNSRMRIWDSMGHVWMMDDSHSESAEALAEIKYFCKL